MEFWTCAGIALVFFIGMVYVSLRMKSYPERAFDEGYAFATHYITNHANPEKAISELLAMIEFTYRYSIASHMDRGMQKAVEEQAALIARRENKTEERQYEQRTA